MPTYEFHCENCSTDTIDRSYDVFVSLNQMDKKIKCPICDNILKRINFNAVPFKI